ncbi:hypothetical protein T439DRAFT_325484 [Meredithblackwellia eburnea MCA 4105]
MIKFIPPELICTILESTFSQHHSNRHNNPSFASDPFDSQNYPLLLSASLVSRTWSAIAQPLLHRNVTLNRNPNALAWLHSRCKGVEVRRLCLRDLTDSVATEVLEADDVVPRQLVLALSTGWMDLKLLQSAKLASLESLIFRTNVIVPSDKTIKVQLPFALTSVALSSHPYFPALLEQLLGPSIRSLDLGHLTTPLPHSYFIPLLPTLDSLSFPYYFRQIPHFLPLLKLCTSLRHFSFANTSDDILKCIPPSVEWVQVRGLCDFVMMKERIKTLPRLSEVHLPFRGVPRSSDGEAERRSKEALLDVCSKRGVKVWFGADRAATLDHFI